VSCWASLALAGGAFFIRGEDFMTTRYVLYIEHDYAPHNVSVHDSQQEAEDALREYSKPIFADNELDVIDEELVEKLAEFNEYARVYRCGGKDDVFRTGVEITPFMTPFEETEAA
jgi:hypothetical protein